MAINWTTIYKKHKGQWIALKSDEKTVISSGESAKFVFNSAIKKGYKKPIITRIPSKIVNFVG